MEDHVDQRLSAVEREQARQGAKLDGLERDVGKIAVGVERLLSDRAAAPQPLSWKTAGATLVSVASAGAVVWGIISMSPAVNELRERLSRIEASMDKRMTEVDAPKLGRLDRLDQDVRRLEKLTERLGELAVAQGHKLSTLEADQKRTSDALGWRPTIARAGN